MLKTYTHKNMYVYTYSTAYIFIEYAVKIHTVALKWVCNYRVWRTQAVAKGGTYSINKIKTTKPPFRYELNNVRRFEGYNLFGMLTIRV